MRSALAHDERIEHRRRPPRRHRDFAALYAVVGREMLRDRDARLRRGDLDEGEAAWFGDLVNRFEIEFDRWSGSGADAGLGAYLATLDACPRVVRLAGHVLLHIVYDLPRVVVASFADHPAVDRARMRAIFADAAPLLHVRSMRAASPWHLVWRARVAGHGPSVDALARAVQTLRAAAWRRAETACAMRQERGSFETDLMHALTTSLSAAMAPPDAPLRAEARSDAATARLLACATARRRRSLRDAWTIERFGTEVCERLRLADAAAGPPV